MLDAGAIISIIVLAGSVIGAAFHIGRRVGQLASQVETLMEQIHTLDRHLVTLDGRLREVERRGGGSIRG